MVTLGGSHCERKGKCLEVARVLHSRLCRGAGTLRKRLGLGGGGRKMHLCHVLQAAEYIVV